MGDTTAVSAQNHALQFPTGKESSPNNSNNSSNTENHNVQESVLPDQPKLSRFTSTNRSFGKNVRGFLKLFPQNSDKQKTSSLPLSQKPDSRKNNKTTMQIVKQMQQKKDKEMQYNNMIKAKSTVEMSTNPSASSSDQNTATVNPLQGAILKPQHFASTSEPVDFVSTPEQGKFPEFGSNSDIVKPIPHRGFVPLGSAPSPVLPKRGSFSREDPNTSPSSTVSSTVKTSRELIHQISSSSAGNSTMETSIPKGQNQGQVQSQLSGHTTSIEVQAPVRMRPGAGRTHFRARPQSLIEKPTYEAKIPDEDTTDDPNLGAISRTSSLVPTYTKANGIRKPLKGSPEVDTSKPFAPTMSSKYSSGSGLINRIIRQKNRNSNADTDFRTASLDALNMVNKNTQQSQNMAPAIPGNQCSSTTAAKVIYDHATKQYFSPADAYKNGIIDVNTFNRCRAKKRFLFPPRSGSVTSITSNGSRDESITGSQNNFVRRIGIHDQRSNEILNLDQAYGRGLLDETRYNTLKNQEMDESFATGRRSYSASALNFVANQQASQFSKPGPSLRSFVGGGPLSPQKVNTGYPVRSSGLRTPIRRSYQSTSGYSSQGNSGRSVNTPWNRGNNRSYSFNSVVSNESTNSTESQGKLFVKNPKTNALVHLETAKTQEIIDEQTYDQLKAQEDQGVNKHQSVVIPSRVHVHIETSPGQVESLSLDEALRRKLITKDHYEKAIEAIGREKLGKRVHSLPLPR